MTKADDVEHMREEADITRWQEAGAPSPLAMWRQLHGVPHADTVPLSVTQAAARINMSAKWVRRRLPALEAMNPPGAYRTGPSERAPWRVIPAALDKLTQTGEPKPATPPRGRRKAPTPTKRSATRWEA